MLAGDRKPKMAGVWPAWIFNEWRIDFSIEESCLQAASRFAAVGHHRNNRSRHFGNWPAGSSKRLTHPANFLPQPLKQGLVHIQDPERLQGGTRQGQGQWSAADKSVAARQDLPAQRSGAENHAAKNTEGFAQREGLDAAPASQPFVLQRASSSPAHYASAGRFIYQRAGITGQDLEVFRQGCD